MKTMSAAALAVALSVGSPAHAHHGVAPHYDTSKPVTIEGVVSNLRRKLEAGGEPRLLHTVRGAGYVLRV